MGRRGDHTFDQLAKMILEAAHEILINEGVHKVSTRKIATKIGYSVGTLYNVFQNLDDIFLNLNGRTLDQLLELFQKVLSDNHNSPIKALAHAYIQFSRDNLSVWSLMFEYRFSDDISVPRWYHEKIDRLFQLVGQAFVKTLPSTDPAQTRENVTVLWSGIHGICVLASKGKLNRAGVYDTDRLIDVFVDNLLNGIKFNSR